MRLRICYLLFFTVLAAVCYAQPANRIKLTQLENGRVGGTGAPGLVGVTNAAGDQRYMVYVNVADACINYTPTATGNLTNLNNFVQKCSTDSIWYIDWEGRSILLRTPGGGGGSSDYDWLEIGNNQIPNSINDSIYTYKYAAVGARLVWPGAELLVNDSTGPVIAVLQGDRNSRLVFFNENTQQWSTIDQAGAQTNWFIEENGELIVRVATSGTPGAPTTPYVNHFAVVASDSTIQMHRYPNTRRDNAAIQNFLYTDANGKVRSQSVDSLGSPITFQEVGLISPLPPIEPEGSTLYKTYDANGSKELYVSDGTNWVPGGSFLDTANVGTVNLANAGVTWAKLAQAVQDSINAAGGAPGGVVGRFPVWVSGDSLGLSNVTQSGQQITILGGTEAALNLPSVTTAQRPVSPTNSAFNYNSTNANIEFFNGSWRQPVLSNAVNGLGTINAVAYYNSLGLLDSDTVLQYNPSTQRLLLRKAVTTGTVNGLSLTRSNNSGSLNINHFGSDQYNITFGSAEVFRFTSSGVSLYRPFIISGLGSFVSVNNRPGYFVNEINDQGTRIYQHIFSEAGVSNSLPTGISPFHIRMPCRSIQNPAALNNNNSIMSGVNIEQTITTDSTSSDTVRARALFIRPTYVKARGRAATQTGIIYAPVSLGTGFAYHNAIVTTSGRVGFGTLFPQQDLHVVGTSRVTGSVDTANVSFILTANAQGDLRRIAYKRGVETGSTNGSGDLAISTTMPDNTYVVTVAVDGTTPYMLSVHNKSTSGFSVRVFDAAGIAVTSTTVTINWSTTNN